MKPRQALLALSLACILLPGAAVAGFDEGVAAYNRKDYATALREFKSLASQGNASAQYNLGVMYDNGQGVAQSRVVAYALFNLSAAANPSSDNKATSNRTSLAATMRNPEIEAAQALTREMGRPRNLLKALDRYAK